MIEPEQAVDLIKSMNKIRLNSDFDRLRTGEKRVACFSPCQKYRFSLEITWGPSASRLVQFIGLNPSTADEMKDDPTVRRCKDFAKRRGFGGMVMTNAFSLRATDPRDMINSAAPCLWDRNISALIFHATRCGMTIACWGTHGRHQNRDVRIYRLFRDHDISLAAFCLTLNGHPQHPLYLKASTIPRLISELAVKPETK